MGMSLNYSPAPPVTDRQKELISLLARAIASEGTDLGLLVIMIRQEAIKEALKKTGGVKNRAARLLGYTQPSNFRQYLKTGACRRKARTWVKDG